MNELTILHNPRCSKSRQTLQLLQDNNVNPKVIEYLKTPPSIAQLGNILRMLGMTDPRQLMRKSDPQYKELNIDSTAISFDELVRLMHLTPKLIERPIVIQGSLSDVLSKAVIGRPPQNALNLL
ncbi:MAG: arsenate reductase [Paraglaciecola sp.]|jgi:arsenate reductase